MGRIVSSLAVLACLLTAAPPVRAQADATEIERHVRSSDVEGIIRAVGGQSGLEHVRVELVAPAGESFGVVFTDSNGRFFFPAMPKKSYLLNISAAGYKPLSETVDLSSGTLSGLDIALHKSDEAPPPPAGSGPTVSAHELSMPESARQAMQDGKEKLHAKNDAQGSLADFQRAVTIAPGFYEAFYEMGIAHKQVGNAVAAQLDIRKSIELSGDHFAQGDLLLGALLIDGSEFVEAEKVLRRAAEARARRLANALRARKIASRPEALRERSRIGRAGSRAAAKSAPRLPTSRHDSLSPQESGRLARRSECLHQARSRQRRRPAREANARRSPEIALSKLIDLGNVLAPQALSQKRCNK